MTLNDFSDRILDWALIRAIEAGKLDRTIFDPDIKDIDLNPKVQAAIDARRILVARHG